MKNQAGAILQMKRDASAHHKADTVVEVAHAYQLPSIHDVNHLGEVVEPKLNEAGRGNSVAVGPNKRSSGNQE